MAEQSLEQARSGDRDAFDTLTGPHRSELQVHCYRMLGSLQDAEDALQETLLAAWLGLEGFEGRSSVRTWLYVAVPDRHQPVPEHPAVGVAAPGGGRTPARGAPGAEPPR